MKIRKNSKEVFDVMDGNSREEHLQHMGWKPHWMRQGDGKGGWLMRQAEIQFIHMENGGKWYIDKRFHNFCPFGLAQMDNGEIILTGITDQSSKKEKTVISFSTDRGRTWTSPERIGPYNYERPIYLAYLGKGDLSFVAQYKDKNVRFFSSDYGRTWKERVPNPKGYGFEGNPYVERDLDGTAIRMGILGYNKESLTDYPRAATENHFCWSQDGGRTYAYDIVPEEWYWNDEFEGKTYRRGTSEGSLVRAANGWLVAALRTDMLAKGFVGYEPNDNLEGIGISISKDDGKTWSPVKRVFDGGKMHANLLLMPDGTLVMTYIMRQDISDCRLYSYTRGCGALLSHDNGLTWDLEHEIFLDSFQFADGTVLALACGHIYSILMDDGYILTCYGHYPSKGGCLIKWIP